MKIKCLLIPLLVAIAAHPVHSQIWRFGWTIINSTIFNKNVYKTKGTFAVTPVYQDAYHINGAAMPASIAAGAPYNVQVGAVNNQNFIRYKIVSTSGDRAYIRFLPGCIFDNGDIRRTNVAAGEQDNVKDLIFEMDIENIDPRLKYLASSAIVGNLLVLPLKIRQKYDDHSVSDITTDVNINYAFGWKYKLGNHPYHSHYLNIIPYAFGFGVQSYVRKLENPGPDGEIQYSTAEDQFSVTYWCSGLSYEYERFHIGYFLGYDMMLKPNQNWVYHRKMWHGIGIGYDLFKAGE